MATLGHFFFKKNPFSQPFFSMVARGEKKKEKKKPLVLPLVPSRLRGRLCKYKEKN